MSGAVVEEVDVNIIKEKKARIGIEEEDLEDSRKELKKFTYNKVKAINKYKGPLRASARSLFYI